MEFHFCAPVRCLFDLDSELAFARPQDLVKLASTRTPYLLDDQWGAIQWKCLADQEMDVVFSSLQDNNDAVDNYAVFQVKPGVFFDGFVHQALTKLKKSDDYPEFMKSLFRIVPERSYLNVCDNTIGILQICVETNRSLEDEEKAELFRHLDYWSNDLFRLSFNALQEDFLNRYFVELYDLSQANNDNLMHHPSDYTAFFDMNNHVRKKGRVWKFLKPTNVLWVNRMTVFHDHDEATLNAIKGWTVNSDEKLEEVQKTPHEQQFFLGWGNNYIYDPHKNADINMGIMAIQRSTYYYTFLDIINRNLVYMNAKLSDDHNSKYAKWYQRRSIDSVNHVDLFLTEMDDMVQGLQGQNKFLVKHLFTCWDTEDLIRTVRNKVDIVRKKVDGLIKTQQTSSQRSMDATIALLSGIALLDFTLNLADFSTDENLQDDHIFGLTDLARSSPPDLMIFGALFVVVSLSVYNFLRMRNK